MSSHSFTFSYDYYKSTLIAYWKNATMWKVSEYGVFSGPYFPVFGLNTEIYSVNLLIQFGLNKEITGKYGVNAGKYGTEKTPYLDTFHALYYLQNQELAEVEVGQIFDRYFLGWQVLRENFFKSKFWVQVWEQVLTVSFLRANFNYAIKKIRKYF